MPVSEVRSGQTASFALKKVKRSQIRKGMVMVSAKLNPRACWEFHGDIMVLHHPTTIATRYQVILESGIDLRGDFVIWIIGLTQIFSYWLCLNRQWCIVVQFDKLHR